MFCTNIKAQAMCVYARSTHEHLKIHIDYSTYSVVVRHFIFSLIWSANRDKIGAHRDRDKLRIFFRNFCLCECQFEFVWMAIGFVGLFVVPKIKLAWPTLQIHQSVTILIKRISFYSFASIGAVHLQFIARTAFGIFLVIFFFTFSRGICMSRSLTTSRIKCVVENSNVAFLGLRKLIANIYKTVAAK